MWAAKLITGGCAKAKKKKKVKENIEKKTNEQLKSQLI